MDRKLLLTAAICFAILFVWQNYVMPPPPKKPVPPQATSAPAAVHPTQGLPASAPSLAPASVPLFQEKIVTLESALFTAEVSSVGGGLRQVTLKDYKEGGQKRGEEKHPVELVAESSEPIAAAVLTLGGEAVPFSIIAKIPDGVGLHGEAVGVVIDAAWRTRADAYTLEYSGSIANSGEIPVNIDLRLQMNGLYNEGRVKERSMFEPPADAALPVFFDGSTLHRHTAGKNDTPPGVARVAWAGIDRQYFLLAAAPLQPEGRSAAFSETRLAAQPTMVRMEALLGAEPVSIAPHQKLPFGYLIYAGPKSSTMLKAPARGFEEVAEYSFIGLPLGFLARPMLWFLNKAHELLHNWGLAILALTLLIKTLLFPVTIRSVKSMQVMRELKPELDKIKERFPGDREKQGLETMRLYRERKVNPFISGCLPALFQLPVWVAVWRTIASAVELYQKDFLWMADLTAKDPYYILPILSGVTTFIQQKITPPAGDPEQQKMMMYMMPPMFTLFMLNLPSGLVFYSLTNGILTIVQQTYITRRLTSR